MSETLIVLNDTYSKEERYKNMIRQIGALIGAEKDSIANMANVAAALKQTFDFFWVGFYIVKENELVLGPFQGPIACTRIALGRGVCGKAWELQQTIIVPDVEKFEGHIACSSDSKSEIVVPLSLNGKIIGVIDIDSNLINDFDQQDALYLKQIADIITHAAGDITPPVS